MHMISKKDLSKAEMDILTKSCSPTIVITANGEVQTHEEAIVSLTIFPSYFVAVGSFTADGGLLQPTGGVKTTSQRTRFRDVKHARIWYTI